ncbi:MAG: PIN domain-containing protein [Methanobacteriota archaeon]
MKDVLIDTNFLTLPHTHKLDVFNQLSEVIPEKHRLFVLNGTLEELKALSTEKTKTGVAAKVGLSLLEKSEVEVLPLSGDVDAQIIAYATDHKNLIVATNDRELKKRLKGLGVEVVSLRGNHSLTRI